ncbi:Pentatricopeptide repeat-containing protein MRL1, chloroplastic [Linum perenne]
MQAPLVLLNFPLLRFAAMDFSISAASQSLTLLSSTKSPSLRPDFLGIRGCGQNLLRPPGGALLRFREPKCRKVRIRKLRRPPRIDAAMEASSSAVLVVAVTTFSAVSFVYLNRYLKAKAKEKDVSNEVLSTLNLVLSHLSSGLRSHINGNRSLRLRDVQNGVSRHFGLKVEEVVSIPVINDKHLQLEEMHYGSTSLAEETVESPTAVLAASTVCDHVVSKDSAPVTASALPLVFDGETSDPMPEKPREENGSPDGGRDDAHIQGTHYSSVITEMRESCAADFLASAVLNNVAYKDSEATDDMVSTVFVNGAVKLKPDSADEVETTEASSTSTSQVDESGILGNTSSFNNSTDVSAREGLYKFFEQKESDVKSGTRINGFKAIYSSSSYRRRTLFPSLKVYSAQKGAELSTQTTIQTPEHSNGKLPQGNREAGPVEKSKRTGSSKEDDQGRKLSKLPSPNGFHAVDKTKPAEQFDTYNYLLKDGRLVECVDFLEEMESKGFLDMNKVYHAKFFNMCKRQKAVKEAFRFCKLIPNPTLSTFNMLMSVCTSSQDSTGAFQVLRLAEGARLQPDCKLFTTLISTCAKCGKVDAMFEVFHKMVNAGVEPNLHTYGALIDGCAKAGQVAKAFGAYGIMRSKKLKPDRVVFNALITACGQSGAVDRAFDVLSEMIGDVHPIDPDHVTVGALIKACAKGGQVDRAKEVYNMLDKYKIKGTPEVYTIAINCCSEAGDWDFAHRVCDDMLKKGILPDEIFLSALIDVAGHAGKVDVAFDILQEARKQGSKLGVLPYSSLMGACSNAKNWHRALELYENMKALKLKPTVPTMNALITALCDGDQLQMAIEVFSDMKSLGLKPNTITYSVLLVASERKDDVEAGVMLFSEVKKDHVTPSLLMYRCIIGLCLSGYEKACTTGEPILSDSGQPHVINKWTTQALTMYREMLVSGEKPSMDVVSQILGTLRLPYDPSVKERLVENLDITVESSTRSNLCSLVDGFGEYDPRAFSLLEEAASLGTIPHLSFKENPIVVNAKKMDVRVAEVYLLTVFRGLKHRLAAGARLPNVMILLPTEQGKIIAPEQEKTIILAGRVAQAIASLLRRLGILYQGEESYGKIRINGITLRRWFQPKLASTPFTGKPDEFSMFQPPRTVKGISSQQRDIRSGHLSLD